MDVELGAEALAVNAIDLLADIDSDGSVGASDLNLLALAYGSAEGDDVYDPSVDLNADGKVDLRDLAILGAAHE
jgi:hypothetical protein